MQKNREMQGMTTLKNFIHDNRKAFIVSVHLLVILASYLLAFFLRFDFTIPADNILAFYNTLPILIVVKIFFLYYFGLFSGLWRYVSIDDLWRILKASTLSTVVFVLGVVFMHGLLGYPRSVIIIDWILYTFAIGGIRFINRLVRERLNVGTRDRKSKKAIIIGAGEAGVLTLRECRKNSTIGIEVIGFIDDDKTKVGEVLQGVKVVGTRKDIADIVREHDIEEIIIAMPSAKGDVVRDILSH